jgi:hypothetical protein
MARPYQPSLLRLLHGTTALLALAAWLSGLVLYSSFDGRWGRLPLNLAGDWIDIHGSLGVILWPLALLFGIYAISLGLRRLQRPGNAAALLALVLAVGSGKLMNEDWLRQGELQHGIYLLHLLAWLGLGLAVLWHLAAVLKRGGTALARSMLSLRTMPQDQPRHWPGQVRRHFAKPG